MLIIGMLLVINRIKIGEEHSTYRLLYGLGVPLGNSDTGVVIMRANMSSQCQYDIEAHLNHIITFL